MMDVLVRVIQSLGLLGVGVFVVFATLNAIYLVLDLIQHDRHVSMIPLIGGVSGFLGCLAIPSLCYYAVAPLILDVGTFTALVWGVPSMLKEMRKTCRCNLLREYVGVTSRKKVHLRLFRRDIVTVKQDFERKPGELGVIGCSNTGKWSQIKEELRLRINGKETVFHVSYVNGQTVLHQIAGFPAYEENEDLALSDVPLQLKYSAPQPPSTDK